MSILETLRTALYGSPPSQGYKPSKEGVIQAFDEVMTSLSTITGGIVGSTATTAATLAALNAAGGTNGTLGLVYNDPDSTKNGIYHRVSGAWVFTGLLGTGPEGPGPTSETIDAATATAVGAAADALTSESAAAESAAFAEEFSGPAYDTIAVGEAATTVGRFFRVSNGDTPRTYTRYQRTSGGSVLAVPLATTVSLATSAGATFIGWIASGANAILRTIRDKMRERVSLADFCTTADASIGFARILAAHPNGCRIYVPIGDWLITTPVVLDSQRFSIEGDRVTNLSRFGFNPTVPDQVAITFNNPTLGGMYQGGIKCIGFYSNNAVAKFALRFVNCANFYVEKLGCPTGVWLGDSGLMLIAGRQKIHVKHIDCGVARPIVFEPNPVFPTLCNDHSTVEQCELVGTSATRPVIEFLPGVMSTNVTLRDNAFAGGREVIYCPEAGSPGNSYQIVVDGGRSEQGMAPTAFSLHFEFTTQPLQSLSVRNFGLDQHRFGLFCRNVQRINLNAVDFTQGVGETAIDVDFVERTELIMDGCFTQVGGVRTLTNAREIYRSNVAVANTSMGPKEYWRYRKPRAFAANLQNYTDMPAERVMGISRWVIKDTLPAGTNTVNLPVTIATLRTGAKVYLETAKGSAAQPGYGEYHFRPSALQADQRLIKHEAGNVLFNGGADTVRLIAGGTFVQLQGITLTTSIDYTITLEADYA